MYAHRTPCSGLPSRNDTRCVRAFSYLGGFGWDVDQQPVCEVNPRQIRRYLSVLLIDIDRRTRTIGIDTGNHERSCPIGSTCPREVRADVLSKADVTFISRDSECERVAYLCAVLDRMARNPQPATSSSTTATIVLMEAAIVVLGSGQDGGSPQLGHTSGVGPDRTASCVAAISPSGSVVLLDASPDMRQQVLSLMMSAVYPADRATPFDAIALTHGHMGHYVGLVHLGKESGDARGIPLLATGKMHTFLRRNEPWRTLYERGNVVPDTFGLGAIRVDDRMTIDAITVPHRAEFTDTVALSVRLDDEPRFLYLPDIDSWSDWRQAEETISAHPMCLLDATFSSADELRDRSVAEIKHPLVTDTIKRFGALNDSTRIVLGHINHSNPLADPESPIAQDAADSGFVIARDGMVLPL